MCLVLLSGEDAPPSAAGVLDEEMIDAQVLAEFPGDWDETPNPDISKSSPDVVPEPTAALLIGMIGFAVMLRRRAR